LIIEIFLFVLVTCGMVTRRWWIEFSQSHENNLSGLQGKSKGACASLSPVTFCLTYDSVQIY